MNTRILAKCWLTILVVVFTGLISLSPVKVLADNPNTPNNVARFDNWQNVGPNGGDVRSLVIDPRDTKRFYFGTLDGQIYTSEDAGQSWRLLYNFNRPQMIVDSLMIDKRDSKTLYMGAHRHKDPGGFYKSTDSGESWREIKDMKGQAIYSLIQADISPDTLMAGTFEGVFVSNNSGNDWKKLPTESIDGLVNVESLAIDPRDANVIYAGTWYRPFKTTDGGKSWRVINKGMIDDSDVFSIRIDEGKPDHVFASACSGIYESKDTGNTWTKVPGIPSQSRRTRDLVQNSGKPNYVYAGTTEGFWMSADGGERWSLTTSRQLETNAIAVSPTEPNKVYIGTNNYGVMVSTDFGKTFAMTNGGYSTRFANQIVADVEQSNRYYATTINTATGGGFFFVSSNGGETWQASMKNYPNRLIAYSILQDAANPEIIYLGTNFGVYRSIDRGASWATTTPKVVKKPAAKGKNAKVVKKPEVVISKNTSVIPITLPTKVASLNEKVNFLSSTHDGKNGMLAATTSGLYRTYDIDKGWERIVFPENFDVQTLTVNVSPKEPATIWVGTARSGLIVSRDGGANWKKETGVTDIVPISAIEIDANDANRVYVGTKQTLFMTKDGGANWSRRGGGLPTGDFVTIAVNPSNSNEIFAGSSLENRGGLYHSVDGGANWSRVDSLKTNLPSRRVWSIAYDVNNPEKLLIGSHSAGIYIVGQSVRAQN